LIRHEKEMLMRKKRKHHRTQPNLFQLPVITPTWQLLPLEVQQRVWRLLVQLFREARGGRGPSQGKEGGDE
jgi:hypothetical protein